MSEEVKDDNPYRFVKLIKPQSIDGVKENGSGWKLSGKFTLLIPGY